VSRPPNDFHLDVVGRLMSLLHLTTSQRPRQTHRQVDESKTLFIVPTDAHYYKIVEMLKQFKITIAAPTCSQWRQELCNFNLF